MLAAELTVPGKEIVRQVLGAGVLINCTQEKVLRFLPPLIIEQRHVDEMIAVLRPVLAALVGEQKGVHA
jgi:acetylornithine aminotransferase